MCGRYSNHVDAMRSWIRILGDWPKDVTLRYNVSPSQEIPVFTSQGGVAMRWGLIPHWSKDGKSKYATFNTRIETVSEKPTYRSAWRKSQRCLIPAQGFFEWRKEGDRKQPYFIRAKTGDPLVFAGVWDRWKGDDKAILSCAIVTKPADAAIKKIHQRMPLIVGQAVASEWLAVSPDEAMDLARVQKEELDIYKVSLAVNNARNDGPELIARVGE